MRLTKFRIKNFKSITDTGYCTFASDLTILVGKNESGKTATLEALKYFNKTIQRVPENAFPLDGLDRDPSVEIWFQLTQEEVNGIQEDSGSQLSDKALSCIRNKGIGIIKNSRGRYILCDESTDGLFREEGGTYKEQIKHIKTAKERLQELLQGPRVPAIDFTADNENIQRESKELIKTVKTFLPSIKDERQQEEAVEAVRTIIKESRKLTEPEEVAEGQPHESSRDAASFFVEAAVQRLPNFIFFTEFSDILPFEIPIPYLKENQAVLDFAKIAGLDIDLFMETQDIQKRINYLNRHAATISGDFLDYWGQNKIELTVKPEGNKLLFGVKESGKTDFFKIEQRSRGFQWFLSFYLRLNAQKAKENIIIIDEPGVHLHAKAQKEIVKVLEDKIVSESQVIFSTHCPYLINAQRLDRVRLVIKDAERGTTITEDVHGHADEESLMPVKTAMGGEKMSLSPQLEKQNVIVGGVADFYFYKALTAYAKDVDLEEINLLPATDLDSMVQLLSLMIGYNVDYQVLLNNNAEGYQMRKHLKERFGLGNERIIFVSKKPDHATEDLFAPEDFNTHVLKDQKGEDETVLNSEYLRENAINRVLLAKKFLDSTQNGTDQIELSAATIASFQKVFNKIFAAFNALPEEEAVEKIEESVEKEPEAKVKRRSLFAFLKK